MAEEGHIKAEVLTPEGRVFDGELFQVSARTTVGEIGIRARHAPMLARLVPSELRLYESAEEFGSGAGQHYAAAEGWLEVFANKVVVLVEEASRPDELDVSELKQRVSDAEQRVDEAEEDTAAREVAERDLRRARAFLELAES